jgi:hypothetical protein
MTIPVVVISFGRKCADKDRLTPGVDRGEAHQADFGSVEERPDHCRNRWRRTKQKSERRALRQRKESHCKMLFEARRRAHRVPTVQAAMPALFTDQAMLEL